MDEIKPTVVAITETHLEEDTSLELRGYCKPFRNDRNKDGGGILIAVREELGNIAVEVSQTKEVYESLWITIDNEKVKLKIGVVYFPQENTVTIKDLSNIYKLIEKEIKEGKEKDQSVIIAGDFNCKVGDKIEGNIGPVSKGGRKLIKMMEKEKLCLTNASEKCKGKWTREENGKKSILDYIIIEQEDEKYLKEMKIDESKKYAPFRLKKEDRQIKTIYSDHNSMILTTNVLLKEMEKQNKPAIKYMTKEGYENYEKEINEAKISNIWDKDGSVAEKFDEWSETVTKIYRKYEQEKKPKHKNKTKTMRLLMKEKRKLKQEKKEEQEENIQDSIHQKIQELKERILEEQKNQKGRVLMKAVESISNQGRFDSSGFWDLQKKINRKRKETPHAVLNAKGEKVEKTDEILETYSEYFEGLLTTTNKKVAEGKDNEAIKKVNLKFDQIMERGKEQEAKQISEEQMKNIVKKLKKKKARDREGWNNEFVLYGGDEMNKSLTKMVNDILRTEDSPKQWNHTLIMAIHKKGIKEDLANKRGLFLTIILSKIFENVIDEITEEIKYDKFQSGGGKGRGGIDNWFILMATIDEAKRLNRNVYLFFGDLVKCFDRLWLQDCLVDLHECGMREREIRMLYRLNKEVNIKVITPVGTTNEILVKEIVKQGSVFGTKLCCASTGKINEDNNNITVLYPGVYIQTLTFVDDIFRPGSSDAIKKTMQKCANLEDDKLWEFSSKKTNWMCQKYCRTEEVEDIEVHIKQGKIKKTEEYEYLGNWVNEKGNIERQLEKMEGKAQDAIRICNDMCSQAKIGGMEFPAKKLVYETVAVRMVYFNIEAWTNLRKKDHEKLESIQGNILKGLFGLPKSTPYWGILYELNILPIHLHLTYKKLMIYHALINSDEERTARQIVIIQEILKHEQCWYGNVNTEAENIGIKLDKEKLFGMKKSNWKKFVKKKIQEAFKKEFDEKKKGMKKLRFLNSQATNTYLHQLTNQKARMAIIIRLNMLECITHNFGVRKSCSLCGNVDDTTEHVFECPSRNNKDLALTDLHNGVRMGDIVEMLSDIEAQKRTKLIDDIFTNFDVMQREVWEEAVVEM